MTISAGHKDMYKWQFLVYIVMNIRTLQNAENFVTLSYSDRLNKDSLPCLCYAESDVLCS